MRDENNRNTLADLTYLEFEAKRRVEDTEMIPQDDLRDVNTYTEQSLSSEDADHIAYDLNEAAPADAKPEERMDPDHSAIDAWEATGADPEQWTIADERTFSSSPSEQAEADRIEGDRPVDETYIRDVADDVTDREWRAVEGEPPSRPGDEIIGQYSGDTERRLAADASLTGSGTAFLNQDIFKDYPSGEAEYQPLEDVPDADAIAANSPVDPAAPPTEQMHGIDLLNGSHGGDD
ncbi:hypothetical protein MKY48_07490 [Paenibacillus sp. FSL W8-0187]|uniref:hypothetical protein n=1 Tax=Paenibacillus sp. FSL W8-0187 TaxID=2921710 RepID=UPI0030DC6729